MPGNDSAATQRARVPQRSPQLPRFIVIEGPLRVGKTTLARILAERLHARRIYDCEDNPFLADFYNAKPGSAFRAQMYFLIERQKRLREALAVEAPGRPLADFVMGKDRLIAKKASRDEGRISLEDLEEVARAYEHFFFRYAASDLLVINTSDIDFVERSEDLQLLLRRLQEPVKGTQYFLPLGASE